METSPNVSHSSGGAGGLLSMSPRIRQEETVPAAKVLLEEHKTQMQFKRVVKQLLKQSTKYITSIQGTKEATGTLSALLQDMHTGNHEAASGVPLTQSGGAKMLSSIGISKSKITDRKSSTLNLNEEKSSGAKVSVLSEDVQPFLRTFSKALRDVSTLETMMVASLSKTHAEPLQSMTEYDYVELEHQKGELERAVVAYEQLVKTLTSKTSVKEEKFLNVQKEIEEKRKGVEDLAESYREKMKDIEFKKDLQFFASVVALMKAHEQYFRATFSVFEKMRETLDASEKYLEEKGAMRTGYLEGHLSRKSKKGWQKQWFVIKDGCLLCYPSKGTAQPTTLNLLLCSVKTSLEDKCSFEVVEAKSRRPLILAAENERERKLWVLALQAGISDRLDAQMLGEGEGSSSPGIFGSYGRSSPAPKDALTSPLSSSALSGHSPPASGHPAVRILGQVPGNAACADCGEKGPTWASINLGASRPFAMHLPSKR